MEIFEQKFEGIYYKYLKENSKRHTLLFLHGLTGNSSVWDDYIELLCVDFNVLVIDLVGQGKSNSPKAIEEYLFQNQAEKIIKLLGTLDIEFISIISYSFSCCLGILISKRLGEKVKSLIFIGPYFVKNAGLLRKMVSGGIECIWRFLILDKKSDLEYSKLKNYEKQGFSDTRYTLKCNNTKDVLGSIRAYLEFREMPDPSFVTIPLLVIHGKNDKMFTSKTREYFKHVRFVEFNAVEDKEHLFLRTKSSELAQIMRSFLIKQSAESPQ